MRGMTSPEPHKADSTAGLAALTPKLQALAKLLDVKSVLVMRSEFDSMVVKHFEEQQMWRGLPHRLPGLHTSALMVPFVTSQGWFAVRLRLSVGVRQLRVRRLRRRRGWSVRTPRVASPLR